MKRARIPVPGALLPAPGSSGDFLYKRETHYHQGLDIGARFDPSSGYADGEKAYREKWRAGQLEILSVTDGVVAHVHREDDNDGYGRSIVVRTETADGTRWFLYGHCNTIGKKLEPDTKVSAGDPIATVGWSGNAGVLNPHLHFEVSTKKLPPKKGTNTTPFDTAPRGRIDPRPVLIALGPFPAKRLFLVDGEEATEKGVEDAHDGVEESASGGFFPLGANNTWHGGVHIPLSAKTILKAPFDGEIVAVRLDPDRDHAQRDFGSTNFILMRHEIPAAVYERMQDLPKGSLGASLGDDDEEPDSEADDDPPEEPEPADDGNAAEDEEDEDGDDDDEAPDDDGAEPSPAPAAQHPERVVYSLLMHVGSAKLTDAVAREIPWLTEARVPAGDDLPPEIAAAEQALARHRTDLAEAASHALQRRVGAGEQLAADVEWVQKRLTTFEIYDGPIDGKPSEALVSAIRTFEETHVFGPGSADVDGIVTRRGPTVTALRKTRRALGLDPPPEGPQTIQPAFRFRVADRGPDDMTPVLSGLDIRVRAGDPLWYSGTAAGFDEAESITIREQVHWEIFSEAKLFTDGHDGWSSVEDPDDDLTADAPRTLVELVDKKTWSGDPPFAETPDGIISLGELVEFYGGPDAAGLRRCQAKFRTEWGLSLPATIARLKERKWAGTDVLADALAPYQWWQHAAASLPPLDAAGAITKVWHYNPIEFVGVYQAILRTLGPPPPKDPAKFADVRVTVLNAEGGTQGKVEVTLMPAGEKASRSEITSKRHHWTKAGGGEARFFDVPKGSCWIRAVDAAQAWDSGPIEVVVKTGVEWNDFTIETPLHGDPPPVAEIRVQVRKSGMLVRSEPVAVALGDGTGKELTVVGTVHGRVVFEGLRFGSYVVSSPDGRFSAKRIELDRRTGRSIVLALYQPLAPVEVLVTYKGDPVEGAAVIATAYATGDPVSGGQGLTGVEGRCTLPLRKGTYRIASLSAKARRAVASPGETRRVELQLRKSPEQALPLGVLLVDLGSPPPSGIVELRDGVDGESVYDQAVIEAVSDPGQPTRGVATFIYADGRYVVAFEDLRAQATIISGTTHAVSLRR